MDHAEEWLSGKDPVERMYGYAKVAIYSCLLNLALLAVKYYLGETSGSLALKADAVHSLADVVSSYDGNSQCACPGHAKTGVTDGQYLNPLWWNLPEMDFKSELTSTCGCT